MRRLPLALLFALVVGLAVLQLIDLRGEVRFAVDPPLSGALGPSATAPSVAVERPGPSAGSELVEGLALPRGDGGQAGSQDRTVPTAAPGSPRIALVITELGLDQNLLTKALRLPTQAALAFSPYPQRGGAWQDLAQREGYEAVLGLPLAPTDPSRADAGPLALDPAMPPEAMREHLNRILARGSGFIALAGAAGAFAGAEHAFAPVAAELARQGLGFVELGGDELAATARAAGLAYRAAEGPIDGVPTAEEIDRRLAAAEAEARRTGSVVIFARPFALGYERLWRWADQLPTKEIALVPLSALLNAPEP